MHYLCITCNVHPVPTRDPSASNTQIKTEISLFNAHANTIVIISKQQESFLCSQPMHLIFFSVQSSESSLDGWQQEQTTPLSDTKSKHYVLSRIAISILKFVFYNTLTCTQHTNQGPTPWSSLDQHHRHRKHLSRTVVSHLGRCHTLAGGLAIPHSDSTSRTNI